jgi:hypothetical protein
VLEKSLPVVLRAKNDKMTQMKYLQMMEPKNWPRRKKEKGCLLTYKEKGLPYLA